MPGRCGEWPVPLTPRWRVALVCFAATLCGFGSVVVATTLRGRGLLCGTVPVSQTLCERGGTSAVLYRVIAVAMLMVVALVCWLLARWCLRPISVLIGPVNRIGPQNLGYRIAASGPRDELRTLADAIDQMMDRIAAGYEGQRRFAANASHELRTPLAVQRTLIEVSMSGVLSEQQLALLTRQLLATNERNERLIEGLLVLSESDQGLVARTPQRLDLIAGEVVAGHAELAARGGVSVTCDVVPREVAGERVLLERLIANLVVNGIKYNRSGGTLHVAVAARPALSVRNTGPTIPAEAITGLFEPFRRLSGDRISHDGGAGLGLTIARSIVQAHDGVISAEPAQPDGLRVEVELP